MDVKEIRKLLDALASSDVNELMLETGDYKLTVRRGADGVHAASSTAAAAPAPAPAPQPVQVPVAAAAAAPAEATPQSPPKDARANLVEVSAPIVGTFYSAPSPDAEPYVKVGDKVERGTVLCIIEAMKLMNEIEAETAGTVREILVQNEEPVEYGQVLFLIDPR